MRVYLFAASLLIAGSASAQDNGLPKVEKVPPKAKNNIVTSPDAYYYVTPKSQVLAGAKLLSTLGKGNKVYALPQDNMPCVVPDMSQYSSASVVKPNIEYTIPNPAYTPPGKVKILTGEQLKQLLEKKQR